MRRPGNIAAWNGPYLKGGVVPPDPWGNPYVYRSPGQNGAYDIISYGSDGQEGGTGAGSRHHELGSADAQAEPSGLHAARGRLRGRASSRCSRPSCCRRCRAARRARGSNPTRSRPRRCSRPTATPRSGTACRSRPRSTRRRAWSAPGATGRVSACRTTWASTRCWRRAAISARPGRRSASSPPACRAAASIALTRLGVGYQVRVNWLTGGVEVVPFDAALSAHPRARGSRSAGFTLIEVLVALVAVVARDRFARSAR